jgi:lipoprotein-releasing system ATP-binding protein
VQERDFSALVGPSGSGKSTLLNIIGLLDQPTSGELYILGQPTREMEDEARTALRGNTIGFVFQFHHLIQAFTSLENVLMPLVIKGGKPKPELVERAKNLLSEVGLGDHLNKKPDELSGGQQQRVAIARALITRPALLLADEPTGNLDTHSSDTIFALLRKFNRERGTGLLIVTHDPRLAARCDRIIELVDGRIASDRPNTPAVT